MAKLCLAIYFFLSCSARSDSKSDWGAALSLLESGKAAEAIVLLEAGLVAAQQRGERVPEAHGALANAYGRVEQWGPSVYHLFQSILLRVNPFYALDGISTLSQIQHRLMIQQPATDQTSVRFRLFCSDSILLALGSIGIWLVLFSAFLSARRRPGLITLGIFLGVAALSLWEARARLPEIGVIAQKTPLFTKPNVDSEKLTELPAGAVVLFKTQTDAFAAIEAPFAGWVELHALKIVK